MAISARWTGNRLREPARTGRHGRCPGTCWLVDLPGDGSNVNAPGASEDPYRLWPRLSRKRPDKSRIPCLSGIPPGRVPAVDARAGCSARGAGIDQHRS
ncbi:hypothetical protein I551_4535 [Mycobacterium ulcerans str. Harvey]|uniref:Uncharacterized protein n=1 Tax=Mycobacterium ulcerans str. Harvey TaxID=1299332 RepID=A0ABN0QWE5_MYCUL|nr:hypothetical protein I551_4535 [Mycobacterium ulcerans str. Harvey]